MATAADYDPLEYLQSQIDEAVVLPDAQPYVPSAQPLERLRALFRGDDERGAANDDVAAPSAATESVLGAGIEAAIGREVLAMVSSRPLPPEAREEAVRRLLVALENPAPSNIRSVLAVLVTGRDDA